jgi:hypothetical protein
MNPRRTIYGPIADVKFIPNVGSQVTGIDQPRLLSRLLLFEEVIISSIRARELPYLVRALGSNGLKEMLSSGLLKLSSDTVNIITDFEKNGKRGLPLLDFSQGVMDIADPEKLVQDGLKSLIQVAGLKNDERGMIGNLVQEKILTPRKSFGNDLLAQVNSDLSSNVKLVKSVLLKEYPEKRLQLEGLEMRLEEPKPHVHRFRTNIQELLTVSAEEEHKMLAKTVGTVTRLNHQLALMQEYKALSTFENDDAELLLGKFAGLIAPYNPKLQEASFLRVLEITDMPEFREQGKIDVPTLLKVRETPECKEFRAWLTRADEIDDVILKEMLTGFRAKAAAFIASPSGKVVRFVANVGLGLIPGYGTAVAIAEGVVDNFFLDKLLPSSGALSFLHKSIPSILKK